MDFPVPARRVYIVCLHPPLRRDHDIVRLRHVLPSHLVALLIRRSDVLLRAIPLVERLAWQGQWMFEFLALALHRQCPQLEVAGVPGPDKGASAISEFYGAQVEVVPGTVDEREQNGKVGHQDGDEGLPARPLARELGAIRAVLEDVAAPQAAEDRGDDSAAEHAEETDFLGRRYAGFSDHLCDTLVSDCYMCCRHGQGGDGIHRQGDRHNVEVGGEIGADQSPCLELGDGGLAKLCLAILASPVP